MAISEPVASATITKTGLQAQNTFTQTSISIQKKVSAESGQKKETKII